MPARRRAPLGRGPGGRSKMYMLFMRRPLGLVYCAPSEIPQKIAYVAGRRAAEDRKITSGIEPDDLPV